MRGLDRRRVEPFAVRPEAVDDESGGRSTAPCIELGFPDVPVAGGGRLRVAACGASSLDRQVDIVQTFFQDPDAARLAREPAARRSARGSRRFATWGSGAPRRRSRSSGSRIRIFDGFIANSPAVARRVHELDGIALDRIAVIPNGVAMMCRRAGERSPEPGARRRHRREPRPAGQARGPVSRDGPPRPGRRSAGVEFVVIGDGHAASGARRRRPSGSGIGGERAISRQPERRARRRCGGSTSG